MAVSALRCCCSISDFSTTVRNHPIALQPRPLFYNTITVVDERALVHAPLACCYSESATGHTTYEEEENGAPSSLPPMTSSSAAAHVAQPRTPHPPPVLKKRKRYRKAYPGENKGITEEMRFVAMKLRNSSSRAISDQEQVGIEKEDWNLSGSKPNSESSGIWLPSIEGFMKYLVDSKLVFQTLERIVEESNDVSFAYFRKTGLERSAALTKDLDWFSQQEVEVPEPSSPGLTYATYLEKLSQKSPPLFLSHFYNIYLAHLSGGQVIAKQVSDKLLEGNDLEIYTWESDPQLLLKDVRDKLNMLGEHWSRDDKNKCLKETTKAFRYMGQIVLLIVL